MLNDQIPLSFTLHIALVVEKEKKINEVEKEWEKNENEKSLESTRQGE